MTTRDAEPVPAALRVAAAIAWRILAIAAALAVLVVALAAVRVVVVAVVLAAFAASVLWPLSAALAARGVPRAVSALIVLVGSLALLSAFVVAIVPTVVDEAQDLDVSVADGVERAASWLTDGPLGVPEERVERWRSNLGEQVRSGGDELVGGVFGGAYLLVEIVGGLALAVVTLFFLLKDGDRIWRWLVRLFPERIQRDVEDVGDVTWSTISRYLRGVAAVALFDAVFIALALWLLGVPLVIPLAALTFVGGFFPIVGAFVAGAVAALVALAAKGLVTALLVVAATVVVQQVESNVLQPFLVGNAVRIHPLAVILAVAAGGVLWGVAGAFFAVPLAAVVNGSVRRLRERHG